MSPHRDPERMPELIRHLYGGDFVDDPGLAHELGLIRRIDEAAYRRQFWALLGWTSVPWLPFVRARTLILHADNDPVFPHVNAALSSRLMRRATLINVKGGGHLFVLTRPEESAGHVNEFLDRSSSMNPRAHRRI